MLPGFLLFLVDPKASQGEKCYQQKGSEGIRGRSLLPSNCLLVEGPDAARIFRTVSGDELKTGA